MFSTSLALTLPSADEFQNSDLDSQHRDLSGPGYVFWGRHFRGAEEEGCKASPSWCTLCTPHAPWALPRVPRSRARCQERAVTSFSAAPSTFPRAAFSLFLPLFSVLATCACACACVHVCTLQRGRTTKAGRRCSSFVSLVFL